MREEIANAIADYRQGEIEKPTPDHVERWISQFDRKVQIPLMRELLHMLGETYFSKQFVEKFLSDLIRHDELAGTNPCEFWRKTYIVNIQKHGQSQRDIRELFGVALAKACSIRSPDDCGTPGGTFIYLDDVLFSGIRIGSDLVEWINLSAPDEGNVHIIVIASHQLGEWLCRERLKQEAIAANKRLTFTFWAARRLENRKTYKNESEVLWPAVLPEDKSLKEYLASEAKFPFMPRNPGGNPTPDIFSSEEGRQLLEQELLMAGMRIRSFSQNPNQSLRPLGFSSFGLGFGSTIITYRNCPNNTPLAFWWGDSTALESHPFSKWYPLVPRKTYQSED